MIRGATRLALSIGITPLVVGLTVVAYGTSAPEVAVNVQAVSGGVSSIAVGNIVGSNIFNVLFILGISALLAPLTVAQRLVRIDVPLMIAVSLLLLAFASDGTVGRLEGGILLACIVLYTVWAVRQSRRETRAVHEE